MGLRSRSRELASGNYTGTLDAFDRQVSLTDPVHGSLSFTWTYRADAQLASVSAPNGNTTAVEYDDAGSPSGKETTNTGGLELSYAWTRTRAGQVVSETAAVLVNSVATGDPINAATDYTYDPLGRLASFERSGSTTAYDWQAVPNREAVQVDSDPATTFEFDAGNRETTSSLGNIDYDDEGRLTARPGQVIEWNDLGQLVAVKDASTQDTIAAYSYDALDRLLTVTHGSDVIRFRYVGLTTQVAEVVDDSSDTTIYFVANSWTGERLFAWAGSDKIFYGTNGHHDVSWTADATGAVSATLLYDPWGNLAASSGTALPDFRFQGSWFDPSIELSWVVTRWYAPQLGRFVSEDSLLGEIENPPARHLYAYATGDPIARWDANGLYPTDRESGSGSNTYKVRPGDGLPSLARNLLGDGTKWRAIYNLNRARIRPDLRLDSGWCLWMPQQINRGSVCRPTHPRTRITWDKALIAAHSLRVDPSTIMMGRLTQLTYKWTGRRRQPGGLADRYEQNIAALNQFAFKHFASKGTIVGVAHSMTFVVDAPGMPLFGGAATTLGSYVFVKRRELKNNVPLQAHEYIHVLQGQAEGPTYWREYLQHAINHFGGPTQEEEAIAYLWQGYTEAFGEWRLGEYGDPGPWKFFVPLPRRCRSGGC